MAPVVGPDADFWAGKRVLLTGHTGFKGGWLHAWLERLGAFVTGYALAPDGAPSLCNLLGLGSEETFGNICDAAYLTGRMAEAKPDIVLHLAAQALVGRSYVEPAETFATNVIGTINLLEAVRRTPSVKCVVSVTTDKVYLNREWVWPYREDEQLGGYDPYSASKACAEIVTSAWRQSYLANIGVAVATARAGNVIGGGDWSRDRLLPDCIAALGDDRPIVIRNPVSTRPWQHVLEPLSGYLVLAERLFASAHGTGSDVSEAWNFGPDMADVQPVSVLADEVVRLWGGSARWEPSEASGLHEAGLLAVDASKARARLGWRPRLPLADALAWTVDWHRRHLAGEDARTLVLDQIAAYEARTS